MAVKTDGGHAKGHSNMNHWDGTETIKRQTKKARRAHDKQATQQAKEERQS